MEDLGFYFPDTLTENLGITAKKISRLNEERICELSALAALLVDFYTEMLEEGLEAQDVLALLADGFATGFKQGEPHADSLPENLDRLYKALSLLHTSDKAALCELILENAHRRGVDFSLDMLLSDKLSGVDVIYAKNALSDEAFDVFAEQNPTLRIKYAKSLRESAAAVASGDASYCLLPLEEAGNRISATASLIIEYDLKINGVTSVFGLDGNSDMKYALLSLSFSVPPMRKDDDVYLEIRLEEGVELYELLDASKIYGYEIYSVSTVKLKKPCYLLVLKDCGEGFLPLILYMTLFLGAYTPVGIYKNLE